MRMRLSCIVIALTLSTHLFGAVIDTTDMTREENYHQEHGSKFLHKIYELVKTFSVVDTDYVEPQHYNYTFMLQNTNSYELYQLRNETGGKIVFAPEPAYKLGPYFGWRWIFLGYTIDLAHLNDNNGRLDFNLSLYSNQIGIDLFYRKSGNSYRINSITFEKPYDTSAMSGKRFDGFRTSVKGFNIYYIFNHQKFSYPAAYSQSTVQRRSCGSLIAGIGYTKHKLNIDWLKLDDMIKHRLGDAYSSEIIDTTIVTSKVDYTDYSVSTGYAYNWVFAHNWLLDVSLQLGLAYKHSNKGTRTAAAEYHKDFHFRNFNLDGITRLGLVWNNTKWFAGANAIFHTYNYRKSKFSTNNTFGNVNIYVGFNFGKR